MNSISEKKLRIIVFIVLGLAVGVAITLSIMSNIGIIKVT